MGENQQTMKKIIIISLNKYPYTKNAFNHEKKRENGKSG